MGDSSVGAFDELVQRLPVGVYRTTPDGRFIAGNQSLVDLFGAQSMDELESVDVRDLYVDRTARDDMTVRVDGGVDIASEDLQLRKLNGERFWVRVTSRAVRADDRTVQYYEGVLQDVTESHSADQLLLKSNGLLDTLTQVQARFIVGADTNAIFAELLHDLLGLTESQYGFIARTLHHEDGSLYLRTYAMSNIAWNDVTRELFEEKGPTGMEFHNLDTLFGRAITHRETVIANSPSSDPRSSGRPDGHPPLDAFLGIPILKAGKPVGLLAVANRPGGYNEEVVDYLGPFVATVGSLIEAAASEEARSQAEAREHAKELLFRSVVETAVDAVIVFDTEGVVEAFNPAAERLFGFTQEDMVGADVSRLVSNERADPFQLLFKDGEKHPASEMALRHKTDGLVDVEASFGISQSEGRSVITAVLRDIRDRKANEETLRLARDAAERGSKAKDEFLAGMSHELRTPLNAVIGLSTMLTRQVHGPINDKQGEYLTQIEAAGRHLLSVINDILDLAMIEADKLEPELIETDIVEVIQQSVAVMQEAAVSSGVRLLSDVDQELPLVIGDGRRLKQVFLNLLSNAIKFSEADGSVGIEATATPDVVRITVWDEGPGIPADRLQDVFEPFERIDSSFTSRHEGSGLGLALSSRFVEAQGGRLQVESEIGKGSRFTVELPRDLNARNSFAVEDDSEAVAASEASERAGRVLLVEDNEVNRMLIADYLRAHGLDIEEAIDGEQGVQMAKELLPDVILMDIQMPKKDGLTATRELKADSTTSAIPIIALTAMAMKGDEERCLEAGCDGYISKPCDPADILVEVMSRLSGA